MLFLADGRFDKAANSDLLSFFFVLGLFHSIRLQHAKYSCLAVRDHSIVQNAIDNRFVSASVDGDRVPTLKDPEGTPTPCPPPIDRNEALAG